MHGTLDEVVPLANGKRLHDLCARPHRPFWLDGFGHNDLPVDICDDYVRQFLVHLDPARAASREFDKELGIGMYEVETFADDRESVRPGMCSVS